VVLAPALFHQAGTLLHDYAQALVCELPSCMHRRPAVKHRALPNPTQARRGRGPGEWGATHLRDLAVSKGWLVLRAGWCFSSKQRFVNHCRRWCQSLEVANVFPNLASVFTALNRVLWVIVTKFNGARLIDLLYAVETPLFHGL
jgi:hypothetical protein